MTSESAENQVNIEMAASICTGPAKKLRLWRVRITIVLVLLIIVGGISLIAHDLVTAGMALFFTGFLALFFIFAIDSFSGDSYGSSSRDDDTTLVDGFTVVSTFQDGGFERFDGTSTPNEVSSNQNEENMHASVSSTVVCIDQTAIPPDSHGTS